METAIQVPLFETRFATGWPGKPGNKVAMEYVPVGDLLQSEEPTDAHFGTYCVPSVERRLDVGAPAELGRVPMVIAVFDVDAPAHICTDEWWTSEKSKIAQLTAEDAHPNAFTYRTRGGYRVVFFLSRSIFIVDDADAAAWKALYRSWLAYLERRFAIVGDPACVDWTRLYRAPHVTRDPGGSPEKLETIGDARAIGAWSPQLIAADMAEEPAMRTSAPALSDDGRLRGVFMDVPIDRRIELATAHVSAMQPSIEGQGGDAQLFIAAIAAVRGFALPSDLALEVLRQAYNPRCAPPFGDARLAYKISEAMEDSTKAWGYQLFSEQMRARTAADGAPASGAESWTSPTDRALVLGNQGQQLPTKFPTLNEATRGGPRAGKLIVVGGAPGAGKTTWATQLAVDYTLDGYGVAILAADEDADGLLIRIGQQLGFNRESLENGDETTRAQLADRLRALPSLMLVDAEEGSLTLEKVSAELLRRSGGPSVLVVDSVQTIRVNGAAAADGPRARIDLVMAALKTAAKQGHLVIATCELARGAYRSQNAADRIDDLAAFKESGGIEYGAAVALVLRSVKDGGGLIDVSIAKNRLGQKPSFRLALDYNTAQLREVEMPDPRSIVAAQDEIAMGKAKAAVMAALLSSKTPTTTTTQLAYTVRGRKQLTLRAIDALIKEGRIVKVPFGVGTRLMAQLDAPATSEL